jgi:nitroreductase
MNVAAALSARRAVKTFDAEAKISDAELKQLFELAQQSPSSFNIQHWRFVNVTDPALRAQVRDAAWGQAQMTDASLLLIVCADIKAWEKSPERYWENAPQEARDMLLPMIHNFYNGHDQLQRDEALRSVGLISQTLMLAAQDLGYDSCPMIGFDASRVAEIIKLPADHLIGMIITVGKAAQPARPKGGTLPLDEILKENHF